MLKRLSLLALVALVVFSLAGCSIGGGGTPVPADEIKAIVQGEIDDFEYAVENYIINGDASVPGMLYHALTPIAGYPDGFELDINEYGASGPPYSSVKKYYLALRDELLADEPYQQWCRIEPSVPYVPGPSSGPGYHLDLELDPPSYANITATGAVATLNFRVYEWAAIIPATVENPLLTDNGTITWHAALINGEWVVTAMYINYLPVQRGGSPARGSGFGFGELLRAI